ncbi:MAG: hypothetical protein DMG21_08290 [Acidobacteria bacterium]|nr:MAG: hypothetical protein DMG21_08290 [Acidobacteriota bacterium]
MGYARGNLIAGLRGFCVEARLELGGEFRAGSNARGVRFRLPFRRMFRSLRLLALRLQTFQL